MKAEAASLPYAMPRNETNRTTVGPRRARSLGDRLMGPLLFGWRLQQLSESAGYFISAFVDALGLFNQDPAMLDREL